MKTNFLNKRLDYFFYFIPVFLVVNLFLRWELTRTISPDTFSYFQLADEFPNIPFSLFPIFYPIVLKIVNIFFNDYLFSYKVVSLLCLLFSLIFVKIKNFYWHEIWGMLCFYSFLRIAPWGLSEVLMIPLLILLFYYNYKMLIEEISSKKFILFNGILLFLYCMTKYSSIFFVFGFFLFSIFLSLTKNKKSSFYWKTTIFASLLVGIYLLINFFVTATFMGDRVPPDGNYFNIRLSFSQMLFNLNPFFHTKNYLGISFGWDVAYIFGAIFFVIYSIIILRKFFLNSKINCKWGGEFPILALCILCSSSFLLFTIYAYFKTKIDILDFRLLLGYYIFIFFAVIVSSFHYKNKNIIIFIVAIFCLLSNIINLIIDFNTQ